MVKKLLVVCMGPLFWGKLSKKKAFSLNKCPDRAQIHLLQSVCAKTKSSQIIAVEHCSAQKLHSSAIALFQILNLLFAGSLVTTVFVTSHTYNNDLSITPLTP